MSNFTETIILNTFDQLLEAMPFEKITVSAIIKTCGISRNTFYYHFQDIYALLDAWLQRELGIYTYPAEEAAWAARMMELLYACRENRKKIYHLYHSAPRGRIEQYLFRAADEQAGAYVSTLIGPRQVSPQRTAGVVDLVRYAIIGFFLRFLAGNMADDIDSSVDALRTLFKEVVEHILLENAENE